MRVKGVTRQNLLPETRDLRDDGADVNVVTADPRSGFNGSAAYGNRFGSPAETGAGHCVKGAGLEACRTIKQHVVPDHVLEEQANAATNDGFAVLVRIPGESDLRGEIQIGLGDPVPVSREGRVDIGICRQITIGAPGVAVVTQSEAESEIRLYLP